MNYKLAKKINLRDENLNEKWLQSRIEEDPSILELGNLILLKAEKRQKRGRIDFLMEDPNNNTLYEIEVQLGSTDESHIIRCIEYWNNEKTRNPSRDHIAVLVAEEITNRFFNVIYLMNKAIPIIGIQLNALKIENDIILDFVKVLDIPEARMDQIDIEQDITEDFYWERSDSQDYQTSLEILEKTWEIIVSVREEDIERNKRKSYITIGTGYRNIMWFRPRKGNYLDIEIRFYKTSDDKVSKLVDEMGITPSYKNRPEDYFNIRFHLKENHLEMDQFIQLIKESTDYI